MFLDAMIKCVTKASEELFWLMAQKCSLSRWEGVAAGERQLGTLNVRSGSSGECQLASSLYYSPRTQPLEQC